MKKILLCGMCLFLAFGWSKYSRADSSLYQPKTQDILYFQTNWLEQELKEAKDKNLVISPMSLYQALALFGHGLNGWELVSGMKYEDGTLYEIIASGDSSVLLDKGAFRIQFTDDMLSDDQVRIVNSIWGDSFLPQYVQNVQAYLKAEAKQLPKNTKAINDWINKNTGGKISNILQEKETTPIDLFLVNAIYFKADWMSKFKHTETYKAPFKSPTGVVDVNMMFDKKRVDYYEDEWMQAIRLPYEGKKHFMTFILPKEHVKWDDFIKKLGVNDFYLSFLKDMPVKIYLPKFKLEYQPQNMKQKLKNMGLGHLFNERVFLGTKNRATLREVMHKSIIAVDEKGTEAAAVTVMYMGDGGLFMPKLKRKDPYLIFRADRPFIFMLDEGLFVGVVNNPQGEERQALLDTVSDKR